MTDPKKRVPDGSVVWEIDDLRETVDPELENRVDKIENMIANNDFYANIADEEGNHIVDENGNKIVGDWSFVVQGDSSRLATAILKVKSRGADTISLIQNGNNIDTKMGSEVEFNVTYGTYTLVANKGSSSKSQEVIVDDIKIYSIVIM